jgi:hypothetical protein
MATVELSRDEQETHFSQTAAERIAGTWSVYTDDPFWIRRLNARADRVSADDVTVSDTSHGGRHYEFRRRSINVGIRVKRQMTDAQREQVARMNETRKK